MNQVAVAVASDTLTSRQSRGDTKTWPSQSKIIELAAPALGVVLHCGSVELQSASWRLLIREWIRRVPQGEIPTMAWLRDSFTTWLTSNLDLFGITDEAGVIERICAPEGDGGHLDWLKNDLSDDLKARLISDPASADVEVALAIDGIRKERYSGDPFPDLTVAKAKALLKRADIDCGKFFGSICSLPDGTSLGPKTSKAVEDFAVDVLRVIATWEPQSRIELHFAGFGSEEVLGHIAVLKIIGYWGGQLRANREEIGSAEPSDYPYWAPIAQTSAIQQFQGGMSTDISDRVFSAVADAVQAIPEIKEGTLDSVLSSVSESLLDFTQENYRSPFFQTLSGLGISNLGKFADFLVHLQAFRSATDNGEATVGGHIESLIISPEHGVRWRHRLTEETHDIEESAHAFE
jgi:hypothetical protein